MNYSEVRIGIWIFPVNNIREIRLKSFSVNMVSMKRYVQVFVALALVVIPFIIGSYYSEPIELHSSGKVYNGTLVLEISNPHFLKGSDRVQLYGYNETDKIMVKELEPLGPGENRSYNISMGIMLVQKQLERTIDEPYGQGTFVPTGEMFNQEMTYKVGCWECRDKDFLEGNAVLISTEMYLITQNVGGKLEFTAEMPHYYWIKNEVEET